MAESSALKSECLMRLAENSRVGNSSDSSTLWRSELGLGLEIESFKRCKFPPAVCPAECRL